MPWPAGLTIATIGGSVLGAGGVPANGTVEFHPPYVLRDATDAVLLGTKPIIGTLVNGVLNVEVPANDSPNVQPQGWAYKVIVCTDQARYEFQGVVPSSPSSTTLDRIVQVVDPTPPATFVPLTDKGVANGVATLDGTGHIPAAQLPAGSGVLSLTAADGTIVIGGAAATPTVRVGAIAESQVTGLSGDLSTLTAAAAAASSAASAAQSTANSASTAAAAAQATANAAYVKPGGGIPETDFAAAVRAILDSALTVAPAPEDAVRYGCHTRNVPIFAVTRKSTINNEAWWARILVRAHVPVASVSVFRSAAAATAGATGLNGMAIYADAGGAPIASTVSDDTMWQATGQISKPLSGPTPTVDTWYWVGVSVHGYSVAPEFAFVDDADTGIFADTGGLARYHAGGYTTWPTNLNPGTDLATGSGFVLPIYLG